ncbi:MULTISPECIES: pyridoxal 5'-phosphate synthase glutaminase subunit PdxT [Dietzia]|uniref:Pyridoxal 5'-phosphate synthase subunit PdxT n=1 Tax=Dietzia maris TaxID=37915 RepID=A0AAE4U619_9ACTN|nr:MULTISPECIES: pyridoxal 5'-phosphate synthase glutaminase subunit PdxT [Dietzia]MBB0990865.1 pyridoxal 5'-phosphate synthase glutaminase subunit PdxT [Dietzia sp. SLG510A3-30A2]MBB0993748.1 pyridoxal 5'-phosphate synthase glutaminase subunit PdxT [Dietzia sp. SLG510A3-40A3]MBB1008061.1 pyridoxal 5'-phosphate synthase glutaminase subunit PdxT [Dietzia sp. SLG510A3-3B2-2]ODQ84258.1 glutamine amidotransferase subunit PdxT [Dietzia alimentaria]HBD22071.1 pyridoxal 5'-phosphate synthase glutamin
MSADAPTVGVLALQGDVAEHVRHLESVGARAVAVRRRSELDGVDGLILPGGESTAMSRLLDVYDMYEPVAERISGGMPVYGSCAGMILLASVVLDTRADATWFSAIDMTVRRNAFGRQVDSFEADLVVDALGADPVRTVFIRAPWVETVGPDVEVLARVRASDGHDHVVAVRQGNALATSFHPEVTDDVRVHRYFVDMVRQSTS